jgi:hypothetical protein
MKIFVVTDERGDILATVRLTDDEIITALSPDPLPGQEVHEIELPSELEQVKDADELHRRLKDIIKNKK